MGLSEERRRKCLDEFRQEGRQRLEVIKWRCQEPLLKGTEL